MTDPRTRRTRIVAGYRCKNARFDKLISDATTANNPNTSLGDMRKARALVMTNMVIPLTAEPALLRPPPRRT